MLRFFLLVVFIIWDVCCRMFVVVVVVFVGVGLIFVKDRVGVWMVWKVGRLCVIVCL